MKMKYKMKNKNMILFYLSLEIKFSVWKNSVEKTCVNVAKAQFLEKCKQFLKIK